MLDSDFPVFLFNIETLSSGIKNRYIIPVATNLRIHSLTDM